MANPQLPKGDVIVPLMSQEYGQLVKKMSDKGNLELLNHGQNALDTGEAMHAGSMRNVEAALNQTIAKNPGVSFYLLRCMRRDFKAFNTFHEAIQVRPMHCPVPQTPGMTLFQWDAPSQKLTMLWSLPVSNLLEATASSDLDKDLQKATRQYLHDTKKFK